jgi:glycosyltransferase involved in cell wall biosynthesis
LTQALSRLLADAGLRQRLGAGGRTLIREAFSPDTMVAGNLAVYSELVPA